MSDPQTTLTARPGRWTAVAAAAVACAVLAWWRPWAERVADDDPLNSPAISGLVTGESGPLAGAQVRFKGHPTSTVTNARGQFRLVLPTPDGESPLRVTASAAGHFIGGADAVGTGPLTLQLRPLPGQDFAGYAWVDPTPDDADTHRCGNCHAEMYDEWHGSGHARSATNRRFLNLYDGSDWHGNADRGWSLVDEHPDGAGVCTSCHAPSVAIEDAAFSDLRQAAGVAALGVHCDFCHKVKDANADERGLTHGVFGLELLRPAEGQLFFGPLDDVDRGEDAYSRVQSSSRFCASCHEGVVFGVHVYSTYTEWLASPARREGKQCQTCHMRPTGKMTNFAPGQGGIERDPATLASHSFMPGEKAAMLRGCLQADVAFGESADGGSVGAEIEVVARNVGHRVPTGFIDRHLVLVVEPQDASGAALNAGAGPTLPPAAGTGLAGKPGRLFGRLLADAEGNSPAPFWRVSDSPEDTRLIPREPVRVRFELPAETASVRVRMLYRRFWPQVAEQKSWPDDTITVVDRRYLRGDGGEFRLVE